jgi:hypothetical protein
MSGLATPMIAAGESTIRNSPKRERRRSLLRWLRAASQRRGCLRSAMDRQNQSSRTTVRRIARRTVEEDRVTIQPVHSALAGTSPLRVLSEIVAERGGRDPFANLVGLRVREWSFDIAAVH